jgi:hypothetical protein
MPTAALKAFLFFLSSSRGNLSTIFCCSDKEPPNKFRTKTFRPKRKSRDEKLAQDQEPTLPIFLALN